MGEGESELLVTQPLLVRPALPRFLRVGDAVTLRTLVRNGTDEARDVTVTIEVEGVLLLDERIHTVRVEAGDSVVFGWPARVLEDGTATVRFSATTEGYGDAVELSLPVYLDVTPETTATGGVVEDAVAVEAVYLPDYVITGSGSLELSLQASLVGALDQELPFFEPYRWESNVRVASRIVATVAVQRASANGLPEAQESQLRTDIDTLITYQNGDGGWGWCRSCYWTDYWVTGWVLIALAEARDAGSTVPDYRNSYFAYLIPDYLNRQTDVERPANPNEHAFLLYALTRALNEGDTPITSIGWEAQLDMLALLEEHRTQLTSWGRAYLVLGLLASGHEADHESVRILLNDLSAATIASANGNHWEDDRRPGSMHNSSVRATALVLRALTEVDPSHPLIEETARWLVVARSADRWKTIGRAGAGHGLAGRFRRAHGRDARCLRLPGAAQHPPRTGRPLRRARPRLHRRRRTDARYPPPGRGEPRAVRAGGGHGGPPVLRPQPALRDTRHRHRGAQPRLCRLTPVFAARRPRDARSRAPPSAMSCASR